jgi:hypothetical protein
VPPAAAGVGVEVVLACTVRPVTSATDTTRSRQKRANKLSCFIYNIVSVKWFGSNRGLRSGANT